MQVASGLDIAIEIGALCGQGSSPRRQQCCSPSGNAV